MTPPVQPEGPKARIRRNIQKMAAQGASQEEIEAYAQYASQRLSVAPKAELPDTTAGGAIDESEEPGYGGRLVRTVLNAASGVPGVEAVMAGAGALGSKFTDNPLSYEESLETLREETGKIPKGRRIASKIVGGVGGGLATLSMLPASPALSGAIYGGAEQALSADPVKSLDDAVMRAGKTVAGAGAGAVLGKGAELAASGVRTIASKGSEAVMKRLAKETDEAVSPLYAQALKEGQGKSGSAVQAFLQKPGIAERVERLAQRDDLAGMAPDDPKFLDELYKDLSDDVGTLKRGLEMPTIAKGNSRRSAMKNLRQQQQDFLDVVSGGQSLPGPMPTYRTAVSTTAEKKGIEEAAAKGHDAVWSAANRNLKSARILKKRGPIALEDYVRSASPEQRAALDEGVIGATKEAFGGSLRRTALPALWKQSSVLRKTRNAKQKTLDDLIRAHLFAGEGVNLEDLIR